MARQSHSARPWAGLNAITGAQQVLERLAAFDVGAAEHPGLGRATLTSTAIESFPKATHTVQNEVRMTFDLRLLPGQDPDERFVLVRDALADVAPWPVEVTKGAFMYPCEVAEDSDLVRHILAGHRAAGLPRPRRLSQRRLARRRLPRAQRLRGDHVGTGIGRDVSHRRRERSSR